MSEAAPSYFATVPLPRLEREARARKANEQDSTVLRWFRSHPWALATAEEVHADLDPGWPLGSTRRAITNLKNRSAVERTDVLRMGSQGHSAHCYRLARPGVMEQGRLL